MKNYQDLFLRWWYRHGGRERCGWTDEHTTEDRAPKSVFLTDRTIWEEFQSYCVNSGGNQKTHDEIKRLCEVLDKAGKLACRTYEDVALTKKQRDANKKDTGYSEGRDGFADRAEKVAHNVKRYPAAYLQYLNSPKWRTRSRRYLDECCTVDDFWICELCGRQHERQDKGRTIQVHHNTYTVFDGLEPDAHLMACCEGLCHNLADIARQFNPVNMAEFGDLFRSLLR